MLKKGCPYPYWEGESAKESLGLLIVKARTDLVSGEEEKKKKKKKQKKNCDR